jgi:hypothetical protein
MTNLTLILIAAATLSSLLMVCALWSEFRDELRDLPPA